ncbi:protein asunder [Drosophila nasuta]|uniref:Protein asunder n=1 Tax=Drosophila albomicans TaxID=7291 RepID=A0A6P8XI51_DROAB|nr:protein asunder [Drosophila albomicans]XP_060647748.1 protein asunder [Drosophila nasuta]
MFERNQKTIFVLDHTRYFSISSEQYISMDYLKGKPLPETSAASATTPVAQTQLSKSLWTCAVESSIEYCRIVWDLFPGRKHVRFIVSDTAAHIVNTWSPSTQNMSHVSNAMMMVSVPSRSIPQSSDYSVIHGLRAAIEALAEPTDDQVQAAQSGCTKISNKGRVICITSARDNTSMKSLEDIFNTVLLQQNALASPPGKKGLLIDHCHLVILNIVPLGIESLVTNRQLLEISPLLDVEIHTVNAPDISDKLLHLIMGHYDLASTTVTNIPMKEEQNANSSANYDVEILHERAAHTKVCGPDFTLPTSIKVGTSYETVTLKWCTPRGCGSADLQPCVGQFNVTPVDVTSRPSSCLINFLLNGRSVLLEVPRKTGTKTTSHMLSARGGEIFVHSLSIARSTMDEAPSISDGPGGRVADYRIAEMGQLLKMSRMVPLKAKPKSRISPGEHLWRRMPRYFPRTTNVTILFNLQRQLAWLPHFLHLLVKEDMDKQEEVRCQQHIHELYKSASRGEMLPFGNTNNIRPKASKSKDQYRLFYRELEQLIQLNAQTTHHKNLLESLQSLRASYGDVTNKSEAGVAHLRSYTESPLSPERLEPNSISSSNASSSLLKASKRRMSSSGQRSLLDMISNAERNQSSKRLDFSGRLCTPLGQTAKLYPDFGNKEKDVLTPGLLSTNLKDESIRS